MSYLPLDSTTCVLPLHEILSGESEDVLIQNYIAASKEGFYHIILDFREVNHMKNTEVSVLVKIITKYTMKGIDLYVYGLGPRYLEILNQISLLHELTLLPQELDKSKLPESCKEQIRLFEKGSGRQEDHGWAKDLNKIHTIENHPEACQRNVKNRTLSGPLQGFGPLWEKTYTLTYKRKDITPETIIETLKKEFPRFQPKGNYFYPSSRGIVPGEVVLLDAFTPGGLVSTGVFVLYSNTTSFTFITPRGHPESGWVTFRAKEQEDQIEVQIQGLASASDPIYELAFRVAGSKLQERVWIHVLESLASYLNLEPHVEMKKTCLSPSLKWFNTPNLWYNAQIRSIPFNIPFLLRHRKDS